jgi:hypothetical protein
MEDKETTILLDNINISYIVIFLSLIEGVRGPWNHWSFPWKTYRIRESAAGANWSHPGFLFQRRLMTLWYM